MPNPVITPAIWAAVTPLNVSNSPFAAFDIALAALDANTAEAILTIPAGATVTAIRNPSNWSTAGTPLLSGGAWAPVTALGDWTVTITAGAAATDPATLSVSSNTSGAGGRLRLVMTGLTGAISVEPAAGDISIDRVLAVPTIMNLQSNPPAPIREQTAVTISASVSHAVLANPAPILALPALPVIVSAWAPDPANTLALPGFVPTGATGNFTAPAVYATTPLNFILTSALDLAANGTIDMTDPKNTATLALSILQARYGMVLVLDRSGSMGSSLGGGMSKWQASVQAAHAWADLFRAFRTGDTHRAGVVTFENDGCSWALSGADDVVFRNPSSAAAIPGATPMSALSGMGNVTTWNLGTPQTCTPIGDGLVKAWDAIGAQLIPDDRAAVVLMTDGYENSGAVTIASAMGSASATFGATRTDPSHSAANAIIGNRLYTLALGTQVDDDRLNTLGSGYYQQITTSVDELTPAFAAMLGDVLAANQLMAQPPLVADPDAPSNALYYRVSTGEKVLAFLVQWGTATDALRIGWRPQGSPATTPFTLVGVAPPNVTETKRSTHGLTRIDLPAVVGAGSPATEWRLQHVNNLNVPQPLSATGALVMVDLVTDVEVGFDKKQFFIGETIGITARIASGGVAVTGATVQYDAARPGESLGTYLTQRAPIYKRLSEEPIRQGADPPKGKGLMVKTLFATDRREDLGFVEVAGQPLFDDGAHGDGAAGDGLYGARYTDTAKEGTYTFRIRVNGTLADGSQFSRIFTRSTWVGVKPDPDCLFPVWNSIPPQGGLIQSLLTIKPQTRAGEFLGPFRGDEISLNIYGGNLVGQLQDGIDGTYSARIEHLPGFDPIVNISIYGADMLPTGPSLLGGFGANVPCWKIFHMGFCCIWLRLRKLLFGK